MGRSLRHPTGLCGVREGPQSWHRCTAMNILLISNCRHIAGKPDSGRKAMGRWNWEWSALLSGEMGIFLGSALVAERPAKVQVLSVTAERMLRVIHLSSQVPINSGQSLLHFSSKPHADLSVGSFRSSATSVQPAAVRAADKRPRPLQPLLSAAHARLINRSVQICLRALPKAWLALPTNHSPCACAMRWCPGLP